MPADPSHFSVYDDMINKIIAVANGTDPSGFYGDDLLVECSMSQEDNITRCIATEFFSNHNWRADPTSLLTLRIKASVSSDPCSAERLQFSHPTKVAQRLSDGRRFILESISTKNRMKPKFHSGRGEDRKPDTMVSDDREWDNLVDFYLWLDLYRKEIALA